MDTWWALRLLHRYVRFAQFILNMASGGTEKHFNENLTLDYFASECDSFSGL